jgi:hypothetical protein
MDTHTLCTISASGTVQSVDCYNPIDTQTFLFNDIFFFLVVFALIFVAVKQIFT